MEDIRIEDILRDHVEIAEKMVRAQGDISPMVIGCRGKTVIPSIIEGGRDEIKVVIELMREDADWIVVIMSAWMRRMDKEEAENALREYTPGQIANDPQRVEILLVQAALRDGSKVMIVEKIIREGDDIRFARIDDLDDSISSFEGYLSL